MHPVSSLPCLQGPTTCSCPKPDESKLRPSYSCNISLNIVLLTTTTSSSGLLARDFPTKTLIHATFPAHFAIDLVTLTMFSDKNKSCSFSLCRFFQAHFMSSHLGLNTFLTIVFSEHSDAEWCN